MLATLLIALFGSWVNPDPTIPVLLGQDTIRLPERLLKRDSRGLVLDTQWIEISGDMRRWSIYGDHTLFGPVVLDTLPGQLPSIPNGTRWRLYRSFPPLVPDLGLDQGEDRILEFRAGLFCLPAPKRVTLSNADAAHWIEACFDLGRLRSGTLGAPTYQDLVLPGLRMRRDSGDQVRGGRFTRPPSHLLLGRWNDLQFEDSAHPPEDAGLHSVMEPTWRDESGQRLAPGDQLPWPDADSVILIERGLWTEIAWNLSADGTAIPMWLTVPGSGDTLFRSQSEALQLYPHKSNRMNMRRIGKIHLPRALLGDDWERPAHEVMLSGYMLGWSGFMIPIPSASSGMSWWRDGRSWSVAPAPRSSFIPTPTSSPTNVHEGTRWITSPPYLRPDSISRVEGLGAVTWDGTFSNSHGTLFAHGRLAPLARHRRTLGSHSLPVAVAVDWLRGQGRDSIVLPRKPIVRFDTISEQLPLWCGAKVIGDGRPWNLVLRRDSLVFETGRPWQPDLPPHADSSPSLRAPSLLWTRGSSARILRALSPLPEVAPIFDSSSTRAVAVSGGVSFPVADVTPVTTRLPPLSFEDLWGKKRYEARDTLFEWVAGNSGSDSLVKGGHAFLGAAVKAWNEHRPLRLSPDAVWMVLLEALATRIEGNPEGCRRDMVRHQGQLELRFELDPSHRTLLSEDSTWNRIVSLILAQMDGHVLAGGGSNLAPVFSTTTPTRSLATRGRLLPLYKHYFTYLDYPICGIPQITLEGTPEDWKLLRRRVRHLGVCGLRGWTRQVDPVLAEFVRASEGHPSRAFWKAFVRFSPAKGGCGSTPTVDGWISALMPVSESGGIRPFMSAMNPDDVPDSHGSANVNIHNGHGWTPYSFRSGFSGVAQHADGSLFPELGWNVWKATPVPVSPPPAREP